MRYITLFTLWICLSILLSTVKSQGQNQQQPQQPPQPNQNQNQPPQPNQNNNQPPQPNQNENEPIENQQNDRRRQNPCDPEHCRTCDQKQKVCMECKKGLFLDKRRGGICIDRDEHEDRGDGFSMAVGIINIVLIVIFTHGWMFLSRNNNSSYVSLDQNDQIPQLNQQNLQQLQYPQQQQQMVNIGAPSDKTSVFDMRSKKDSKVQPIDEEQNFYNDKNEIKPYQSNEGSPVGFASLQMEQIPNHSPTLRPTNYPTDNQQQQYQSQQQQQIYTSNLNGYWLTQAGKFSFKNFSNLHRIKHVMINFLILQRLFSSLLAMSGRRGDDDDDDDRKNLMFVGFALVIILQWLFTFIPVIILKISTYCLCLKNDPNGRCSSIFINILFYFASVALILPTTNAVFRMDGFEAQVWVLLVLSGFLLCVYFDKKSVEFAKKNRNGKMESLIRFRKLDFNSQTVQA